MGLRPFLVCAVLLALPAEAAPLDDAKAEFGAGKEAFERGEYEKALQHYQRANQLVPAASLQYNIGTCHEHLGRYGQAAAAFERYLEMAGPSTTDDEKEFQDKLRARIAANKKRATEQQPPPTQPPQQQPQPLPYQQPYYTPPPPTYYVPATPPPPPREYMLQQARARRNRAIGLMAAGVAFTIIGIGLIADGATNPHQCSTLVDSTHFNSSDQLVCSNTITDSANVAEDFFGVTFTVVGVTMWGPGAASYVSSEKQINTLMKEEAGTAPKAWLFHSPTIRF